MEGTLRKSHGRVTCVELHNIKFRHSTSMPEIFNPNPTIFATPSKLSSRRKASLGDSLWDEENDHDSINDTDDIEPIDQEEIFGASLSNMYQTSETSLLYVDLIRSINDPEHPNTLEQLRVVSSPQIDVQHNHITVEFTPTVPHCGMSTLIGMLLRLFNMFSYLNRIPQGLSIRVRLMRSLPNRFKVDIYVKPGSHQSEQAGQSDSFDLPVTCDMDSFGISQ
jgi:hypothetical protein